MMDPKIDHKDSAGIELAVGDRVQFVGATGEGTVEVLMPIGYVGVTVEGPGHRRVRIHAAALTKIDATS